MIFQIFRIRKTVKDIKEAKNDPTNFAKGQASEALLGILLIPLLLLGIVAILGLYFGYVVEDGSGFMKVLFWIFAIPFSILIFVYILAKKVLEGLKNVADDFVVSQSGTVHRDVEEVK